jgi:hypothetical protein
MRYDKGLRMDSRDGRRLAVVPRKGFRRKKANPDIHNRSPDLFDGQKCFFLEMSDVIAVMVGTSCSATGMKFL